MEDSSKEVKALGKPKVTPHGMKSSSSVKVQTQ
jgi:hypothetical protein